MCSSSKSTATMNQKRRPNKARKSKAKTKKPKFISLLRLQFPAEESTEENKLRSTDQMHVAPDHSNSSQQLNLFPLHPENQALHDREINNDHENVAYFFSAADGGATTTLTGLLDESTATPSISSHTTINNGGSRQDEFSPPSASLSYAYRSRQDSEDRAALVRNALRNRERDSSEEKWICYSEVVEKKVIKEEEVTSSAIDLRRNGDRDGIRRLSLKLDYQEILNAWSDKGPLYIHAESSQIVPDMMNDDFPSHEASSNGMGWGSKVGLWTVPEMVGDIDDDTITNGEMRLKNEAELRIGKREASVLRYKEKRRNRLFEKKIRYQVRKLNAEKRPRLKGRFVKRS